MPAQLLLQTAGRMPWDRYREMNVQAELGALQDLRWPALECLSCTGEACGRFADLCAAGREGELTSGRFGESWGWPSMLAFHVGGLSTATVLIEIDPLADLDRAARVCILPYRDFISCDVVEPACAESGQVVVEGAALGPESMHGSFFARFGNGDAPETIDIAGVF